ncbi:type II toxin-antitoxin system RelE/ParE family toxin [Dyadobacter subterraneus]|uniref:Type II toxin-antitoxin system RelE/ParE family toxin n=1 Tax=Dyadobacter subterraneus TaxID=2773304 RepID=A0ABR9W7M4_9BACT|nr:type II toxin-antitoxin system RelE/ParE family toxin [Dyadobacter subterraneus]MBE9460951.1 type II toxin-antitoxin system RelE/ParE family toxin [Dyadobacter subterraneus]
MIENIQHKGLRFLFENDDSSKLNAHLVERLREILSLLDTAETVEQLNIPGYRLHKLSGELKEFYSIKVNANYRIIFRFNDGDAYDVDFLDYH